MTNPEIKAALGLRPGASGRQVENAAIRAWIDGGHDTLDAMELVNRLVRKFRDQHQISQRLAAEDALDDLRAIRKSMLAHVRVMGGETVGFRQQNLGG